jgi:hypothetical protein
MVLIYLNTFFWPCHSVWAFANGHDHHPCAEQKDSAGVTAAAMNGDIRILYVTPELVDGSGAEIIKVRNVAAEIYINICRRLD